MRRPSQRDEFDADVGFVGAEFDRLEALAGGIEPAFNRAGIGLELRVQVGDLLFDRPDGFAGAGNVARLLGGSTHAAHGGAGLAEVGGADGSLAEECAEQRAANRNDAGKRGLSRLGGFAFHRLFGAAEPLVQGR